MITTYQFHEKNKKNHNFKKYFIYLQEHIASKHTKTHEHKCEGCDKTFAHRTNYMRHLKSVHSNKSSDEEDLEENQLQTQELDQMNIEVVGLGSKKNSRRKIT